MAVRGAVLIGPGVVGTHLDVVAAELAARRVMGFGAVRVRTATRTIAAGSAGEKSAGEGRAGKASGPRTHGGAATLALEVERAAPHKRRLSALDGPTRSGPWRFKCWARCANRMLTQI